jgi:chitodextrinase
VAAWNLFYANATDQVGSNLDPAHTLHADPLLAADGSLRPGSPAIDAGTDFFLWQGMAVVDLAPGDFAGAAPDLGAVEFAGSVGAADASPPGPPGGLWSPAQGTTSVELAWSAATDAGSGVASYRVYREGVLVGSTADLLFVATGLASDQSHRFEVTALDAAGNESAPSAALVVSTLDPTAIVSLEVAVGAGSDDAEEYVSSGAGLLTSSDLELGAEGSSAQRVGLRFRGVQIPRGARIAAAHVQFAVDESSGSGAALEIRGQAADAAAAFSGAGRDLASRPTTASAVAWTAPAWPTVGEAGAAQRTPDLRRLVQEIVDRPGWSSGNPLVLLVTGTGSRVAESFEGSRAAAPLLEIDFTHEGVAPDRSPPSAPAHLRSPSQTAESVELAWDPASDDVGVALYEILRDGAPAGSTPATRTTIGGLAAGTRYEFRVLARDAAGNASAPSEALAVTTAAGSALSPLDASVALAGGGDDAEERLNLGGAVVLDSTDLELTRDGTREQVVGLRFRGVPVPPGAAILSAHVQFTVDEPTSGSADLEIRAEAADDAAPFASAAGNLSARRATSAFAAWRPPAWSSAGAAGADQRTPDLAPLLQEVVSRSGWASGHALVLLVTGSGARVAQAFEMGPARAPVLVLRYGMGPPVPDSAPPDAPANLRSPGQTATSIDLLWDAAADDAGVVGYRVYRDGALAASSAGTAHTEQGLAPATSHLFQVTALDAAGHESAPSEGLLVSTQASSAPLRLVRRVSTSQDDAEEVIGSGEVTLTSGDLELTEDGSSAARVVGLRFADLALPPRARIVSAHVQFAVDETGSGASALTLRAQDADDAAPFTTARGSVSARPRSAAAVAWSPAAWTALGAAGAAQRTPDLAALVQDVVDRPGFRSGNAFALLVTGSGARVAESFDGSPGQAPLLELEYLAP